MGFKAGTWDDKGHNNLFKNMAEGKKGGIGEGPDPLEAQMVGPNACFLWEATSSCPQVIGIKEREDGGRERVTGADFFSECLDCFRSFIPRFGMGVPRP